jgi:hypothetical protein
VELQLAIEVVFQLFLKGEAKAAYPGHCDYSNLSATSGSTLVARSAGI